MLLLNTQFWFQWPGGAQKDSVTGLISSDGADVKHLILAQRHQATDPPAADLEMSYMIGNVTKCLEPDEEMPHDAGTKQSPLIINLPGKYP